MTCCLQPFRAWNIVQASQAFFSRSYLNTTHHRQHGPLLCHSVWKTLLQGTWELDLPNKTTQNDNDLNLGTELKFHISDEKVSMIMDMSSSKTRHDEPLCIESKVDTCFTHQPPHHVFHQLLFPNSTNDSVSPSYEYHMKTIDIVYTPHTMGWKWIRFIGNTFQAMRMWNHIRKHGIQVHIWHHEKDASNIWRMKWQSGDKHAKYIWRLRPCLSDS